MMGYTKNDPIAYRKQIVKWCERFDHSPNRPCDRCHWFKSKHNFCNKHGFLTRPKATCNTYLKAANQPGESQS